MASKNELIRITMKDGAKLARRLLFIGCRLLLGNDGQFLLHTFQPDS